MEWLRLAYAVVFAATAVTCLASVRRTSRIRAPDTRRGLASLLLLSGIWAGIHVGRILAPDPDLKIAFYIAGLAVGLATVGAWLYFCSAYTGHDYHRRKRVRLTALLVYAAIVGVKLTNPVHGLYFTTSFSTEPFPHLIIDLGVFHWFVTGLAYSLPAVGLYLLYELFTESGFDTTRIGGLVVLLFMPVVLDLVGYLSPGVIITLNYEPIGVALFAIGTLYLVEEQFVAIPRFWRETVLEEFGEAVILVDRDRIVRDYNATATDVFPSLSGGVGRTLESIVPPIADAMAAGDDLFTVTADGDRRHYVLDRTRLESGAMLVGEALVCTDVTRVERQRRELRRQNEQLDDFAAALTHELRNSTTVIRGHLDLAARSVTAETPAEIEAALDTIERTTNRVCRVVEDLSTLARYGQTLDDVDPCPFRETVNAAWRTVELPALSLVVDSDGAIEADRGRLEELLRDAFQFANANGAGTVTVTLHDSGFTVTGDGEPIDPDVVGAAFDYGAAVPSMEAGTALPNVRSLARVHGWTATIDPEHRDGVRVRIDGATVIEGPRPVEPPEPENA